MTAHLLFYIIIGILIVNFVLDKILDTLNARHFNDPVPKELADVYDSKDYLKSQQYKTAKYRFGLLSSSFSFVITMLFFLLGGFEWVDVWARSISEQPIILALLFFGIIMFASGILGIPFSYYNTFVIEEQFGFNKMTLKTFILDKIKGGLMAVILGGGILALIIWFYQKAGTNFWWIAWIFITLFSLVMNLYYARLIVPLFNKQSPLEQGALRSNIEAYAAQVGFSLNNIFVIDGSKRSSKANAYFSGFGREKRITLYDTLIEDLEEEEVVAVLAHEVGHYKRKHIIYNLCTSILTTGFMLWLLSKFVHLPIFSEALGVSLPSFHVGLTAFGVLYTPVSEIMGLFMNFLSRKFEYQADDFARKTYAGRPLVSALKKLSKNSLSNLTPHPAYVFFHYSHPTLLQRFQNLKED